MRALMLVAPIMLPLIAAGLSVAVWRRSAIQRAVGVGVLLVLLVDAVALLLLADRDGAQVLAIGGWPAPLGISLVADRTAMLMLTMALTVSLAILLFAVGQGSAEAWSSRPAFHPAYLVLVGGVALAFLTGDLFNLFVAFEVMLAASYVLISLGTDEKRTQAGMTYTITSLVSSLIFLTAIALVYAATGTVNFADLSIRVPELEGGVQDALSLLLLIVFGIKAAMVPLHFWLPDSYPTAPAPITAVLAALLTKVGLYAMVRTQTLMFSRDESWTLLLCLATATMLVGVLGAVAQKDLNRMLSFVLVSHIGYMLFGLALFTAEGLSGTLLYAVHHIAVQAALFLIAGLVAGWSGTAALQRLTAAPPPPTLLAGLFLVSAMSLAGLPPFSGFIGKVALLQAGVDAGGAPTLLVLGALLVTSLLTLYAMARVWRAVFAQGPDRPPPVSRHDRGTRTMLATTAGVVAVGIAVALAAGPLSQVTERAGEDLRDPVVYQEAVLPPTGPSDDDPSGVSSGGERERGSAETDGSGGDGGDRGDAGEGASTNGTDRPLVQR
ncbi:proton-conducting transporter transmembrane domain-containing protein [Streptomyces tardus]|uniref:proton-conducting transporter transmembrane domain-containing protein n=1 Tax=Streptomyces tardus TaxID=2780544 RepID=UPI001B3A78C3|nr:proton-conducting transporter membrane subunit [Streptomyces tardus]